MGAKSIYSAIVASAVLMVTFFTNCTAPFTTTDMAENQSLSISSCSDKVPEGLRDPKSIDEAVQLMIALPKPTSIDCFLTALKNPLQVYAVESTFSAQPSAGRTSPRIFIVKNALIMSVVPAGEGKNLVEFSQVVSANSSVKGEVEFPLAVAPSLDAPYTRILNNSGTGTTCITCHNNESPYQGISNGPAFVSKAIAPDYLRRVRDSYLKNLSIVCDMESDSYRCTMLRAIYLNGQAKDIPLIF